MFKKGKMSTIRYNANRSRKLSDSEKKRIEAHRERFNQRLKEEQRPAKTRRKINGVWVVKENE